MPPAYVKPYIKRQKNDTADAEAICEAVTRANMRFVATKTPVLMYKGSFGRGAEAT
jgi:transposase